jgi:hypothetical protein
MKTAILIGGGTSVLDGIELDLWNKIKDKADIFSINYAFKTMPYLPNKQVWTDTTFFRNNVEALENLYKHGVECHTKKHGIYNAIPEIKQHDTVREEKDASNKLFIGLMGLSGMLALALAINMQYERIFLLGYDFGTSSINNTHTHYYQKMPIPVISSGINNPQVYLTDTGVKKDVKQFNYFNNKGSIIYNVSLRSNIQSFPKIRYEEMFTMLNENKYE